MCLICWILTLTIVLIVYLTLSSFWTSKLWFLYFWKYSILILTSTLISLREVIWGSHILICISKTHSYLKGDYHIAYHIILFIGTNYTLYHQLTHCLYTIQVNQKVTMKHVLNMWIPTKRYIILSYQLNYMLLTRLSYMFLRLLGRLKYFV